MAVQLLFVESDSCFFFLYIVFQSSPLVSNFGCNAILFGLQSHTKQTAETTNPRKFCWRNVLDVMIALSLLY